MPSKESARMTPDEIIALARKKFPGVTIHRGSDPAAQLSVQPFGIPDLDSVIRGMLCGGYTTLWGPDRAGKTTLACRAVAQAQRDGRRMLWTDLEGRFDPHWAAQQGIDLDKLWIQRGGIDLEANLDAVNSMIREKAIDGLVIDSISSRAGRQELMDKNERAKSVADDTVANIPKKLSQWFRMVTALIAPEKIPVLLLSQVRTAGIGHGQAYLDKTGGKALAHYGSTELKITRQSKIEVTKDGTKQQIGYWMRIEVKKTSLTPNEGKQILLPFYFGIGIDDIAVLVRAAISKNIAVRQATGRVSFRDTSFASEHQLVLRAREKDDLYEDLVTAVTGVSTDSEEGEDAYVSAEPESQPIEPPPTEYVCTVNNCGHVAKTEVD